MHTQQQTHNTIEHTNTSTHSPFICAVPAIYNNIICCYMKVSEHSTNKIIFRFVSSLAVFGSATFSKTHEKSHTYKVQKTHHQTIHLFHLCGLVYFEASRFQIKDVKRKQTNEPKYSKQRKSNSIDKEKEKEYSIIQLFYRLRFSQRLIKTIKKKRERESAKNLVQRIYFESNLVDFNRDCVWISVCVCFVFTFSYRSHTHKQS